MNEIETNEFRVGDQIRVGRYTATCQKTAEEGALFLLDQCLDESMQMNSKDTNEGGYEASDLRKELNSARILKEFDGLKLKPFENGDLLRIPFYGEIFGHDDDDWCIYNDVEPDDCKQWKLMKERINRIAERKGDCECWWFQNKDVRSSTDFCGVHRNGYTGSWSASDLLGVRPVFLIPAWPRGAGVQCCKSTSCEKVTIHIC